jgi:hypothetical protein
MLADPADGKFGAKHGLSSLRFLRGRPVLSAICWVHDAAADVLLTIHVDAAACKRSTLE